MKQLTVRGVDDELHHTLRQKAEYYGLSMNQYVLRLLKESTGLAYSTRQSEIEFSDLDDLAGTWGEQEFQEFKAQLELQRTIDEELWSQSD